MKGQCLVFAIIKATLVLLILLHTQATAAHAVGLERLIEPIVKATAAFRAKVHQKKTQKDDFSVNARQISNKFITIVNELLDCSRMRHDGSLCSCSIEFADTFVGIEELISHISALKNNEAFIISDASKIQDDIADLLGRGCYFPPKRSNKLKTAGYINMLKYSFSGPDRRTIFNECMMAVESHLMKDAYWVLANTQSLNRRPKGFLQDDGYGGQMGLRAVCVSVAFNAE
ncbi:MAG: hypothetical protein AAB116_04565 [Candidatus Poribacteria bacterium]